MKTTTFTLAAFAGLVAGQSLGDIPSCAIQCGRDLLSNQGTEEIDNCEANDVECLCQDERFILGIRDCATSVCGGSEAESAVEAGLNLCRGAGVEITTPPVSSATDGGNTESDSASATATSSGGNGGAGGLVSTFTSDGSAIVTTLSTSTSGDLGDAISSGLGSLSSGLGSVTSGIGSAISSATSGLGSVTSELGSLTSELGSSVTGTDSPSSTEGGEETTSGSGGNSEETSEGSADSTEDGEDAAPMATAAPVGILAAAGIAAFML